VIFGVRPAQPGTIRTFAGRLLLIAFSLIAFADYPVFSVGRVDGALSGTVVDADTGKPIAGVDVTIRTAGAKGSWSTRTNGAGRFVFSAIPGGRHSIVARHPSFVPGYYGGRFPGDQAVQAIEVPSSGESAAVTIRLWRFATVEGRVTFPDGEEVVSAPIVALRQGYVGGRTRFDPAHRGRTDDRGMFRLSGLIPGTYVVGVLDDVPSPATRFEPPQFPLTYFPSASRLSNAHWISLSGGEIRSGVEIALANRPAHRLMGRVLELPTDVRSVKLDLIPVGDGESSDLPMLTVEARGPNFAFEFASVPQGRYAVRFIAFYEHISVGGEQGPPSQESGKMRFSNWLPGSALPAIGGMRRTLWSVTDVEVNGDRSDLQLAAGRGFTISGKIELDGVGAFTSDELSRSAVLVMTGNGQDLGSFPITRLEPDGSFETVELPPGRYILHAILPRTKSDWTLRAVVANGVNVIGTALDLRDRGVENVRLILTNKLTSVGGTVALDKGLDRNDVSVFLFPTDRRAWIDFGASPQQILELRPDSAGHFRAWVPPGEYYLVASLWTPDWLHPQGLERLSSLAERVTVLNGDQISRALKVRALPRR
jgi:hypothetical protein